MADNSAIPRWERRVFRLKYDYHIQGLAVLVQGLYTRVKRNGACIIR